MFVKGGAPRSPSFDIGYVTMMKYNSQSEGSRRATGVSPTLALGDDSLGAQELDEGVDIRCPPIGAQVLRVALVQSSPAHHDRRH